MSGTKISKLSSEDAIARIIDTVKMADAGAAPFALVLGSGFSDGLVPNTRELVETSLPLWMKSRRDNVPFADLQRGLASDTRIIAHAYWKDFCERNKAQDLDLMLDDNGMPESHSEAYMAAFDPKYSGAVNTAGEARKFQLELMRLDQPRLNAAHFMLASLLGVQPGKRRESNSFRSNAAFSRLIFTTNFDPFLQVALQAVNRLYFMSDTPELGMTDEVLDDQSDAIHLVYVHGSIHRRSQAATEGSIQSLKKNAQILEQVLKRHGVIVLGYKGWDDAIVEALAKCDKFENRLYWCGRGVDPLRKGAFGSKVQQILQKESAFYVQIDGAGDFMTRLFSGLVNGRPRLLENPIQQVREMLGNIDLKELESLSKGVPGASGDLVGELHRNAFVEAQNSSLSRLLKAEELFLQIVDSSGENESAQGVALVLDAKPDASRFEQLVSSAGVSSSLGKYADAIELLTQALSISDLKPLEVARVLFDRGVAFYLVASPEQAVADWSRLIDLAGAPVEWVAQALVNRGVVHRKQGEPEKAIEDYTKVIDLAGAPVEPVAHAVFNRGLAYGKQGEAAKESEDYSRVVLLAGAPIEHVAKALINRGVAYGKQGAAEKEFEDYSRVIEFAEMPEEWVAQALINRGWAFGKQGEVAKELKDYTRVIDLAEVPVEPLAHALIKRGLAYGKQGEVAKQLEDYTRVIDLAGVPVESLAQALLNRGLAHGKQGEMAKEFEDNTRVIEFEGMPVEYVATALNNRSLAYGREGKVEKAIEDCTRVIEDLPGASAEMVARAFGARGWKMYEQNKFLEFLVDSEAALRKFNNLDFVAFNFGLALLAVGRDADAIAAYLQAAERFPTKIEEFGLTDLRNAEGKWLSPERAKPIIELLQSKLNTTL